MTEQDISAAASFVIGINNQINGLNQKIADLESQLKKIIAAQKELNKGQ